MVRIAFLAFFLWTNTGLALAQLPEVYLLDPQRLAENKKAYQAGDTLVVKQVSMLIRHADGFLDNRPTSVMDKSFTPPSGDKHDYMSMGPYWWPDPSKPDGLPYIRKDGQVNPEVKKISDHDYLAELERKCRGLAMAYYFTGKEQYAAKAKTLLNAWFVDEATRMNPNLNYGQAIPGITQGRGIGIIETRWLANLADWVGLLQGSASYSKTDREQLKTWYKEYLTWLQTSRNGLEEKAAKNNHGTFYDYQLVGMALFTGQKELAKKTLLESRERFKVQIEKDGKQELELERTNAYTYSAMNLGGWFGIAMLGEKAGVDFWNYDTDGRNLRSALDWLLPQAFEEQPRAYQQISSFNKNDLYYVLILAAEKYKNPGYAARAKALNANGRNYILDLLHN
jgi:hypothetical protein